MRIEGVPRGETENLTSSSTARKSIQRRPRKSCARGPAENESRSKEAAPEENHSSSKPAPEKKLSSRPAPKEKVSCSKRAMVSLIRKRRNPRRGPEKQSDAVPKKIFKPI